MVWGWIVAVLGAVGLIALFAILLARSERKRGKADAIDSTQKENERRNAAAGEAERDVDRLGDSAVRDRLRKNIRNGKQ